MLEWNSLCIFEFIFIRPNAETHESWMWCACFVSTNDSVTICSAFSFNSLFKLLSVEKGEQSSGRAESTPRSDDRHGRISISASLFAFVNDNTKNDWLICENGYYYYVTFRVMILNVMGWLGLLVCRGSFLVVNRDLCIGSIHLLGKVTIKRAMTIRKLEWSPKGL